MCKKLLSTVCAFALLGVLFVPTALAADSPDEAITHSIREDLRESVMRPLTQNDVDVFTKDGVVYLRGRVSQLEDSEAAEKMARATPGVQKVVNELQITTGQ